MEKETKKNITKVRELTWSILERLRREKQKGNYDLIKQPTSSRKNPAIEKS